MRTRRPTYDRHRRPVRALRGAALALALAGALATPAAAQQRLLSGPPVGSTSVGSASVTGAPGAARPLASTLRLEADLTERTLYVWAGDSLLALYPVAVGKA